MTRYWIIRWWSAIKLPINSAREDKAPQPVATQYRGLATVEMAVPTGRYPTTRYGLVELEPKRDARHQLRRHLAHLRHPIIGDSMATATKTAAPQSILPVVA